MASYRIACCTAALACFLAMFPAGCRTGSARPQESAHSMSRLPQAGDTSRHQGSEQHLRAMITSWRIGSPGFIQGRPWDGEANTHVQRAVRHHLNVWPECSIWQDGTCVVVSLSDGDELTFRWLRLDESKLSAAMDVLAIQSKLQDAPPLTDAILERGRAVIWREDGMQPTARRISLNSDLRCEAGDVRLCSANCAIEQIIAFALANGDGAGGADCDDRLWSKYYILQPWEASYK